MLVADGEHRLYTAIKSLSRLLKSSNIKHKCKQHFCMSCFQGFSSEISRDKHFKYCKDNETVRIKMPKEGSLIKFHDGQYQFKFHSLCIQTLKQFLSQSKDPLPTKKNHTLKKSTNTSPLAFAFI